MEAIYMLNALTTGHGGDIYVDIFKGTLFKNVDMHISVSNF